MPHHGKAHAGAGATIRRPARPEASRLFTSSVSKAVSDSGIGLVPPLTPVMCAKCSREGLRQVEVLLATSQRHQASR